MIEVEVGTRYLVTIHIAGALPEYRISVTNLTGSRHVAWGGGIGLAPRPIAGYLSM